MSIVIRGKIEGKTIKLSKSPGLPRGTVVDIHFKTSPASSSKQTRKRTGPDWSRTEADGKFIVLRKYAGINVAGRKSKVVSLLKKHGSLTRADYQRLFRLREAEALKELKALLESGVLLRKGRGSGTHYVLAKT